MTIYFLVYIEYIPSIATNLREWANLDKTFTHFLLSCATDKFYLFNFLFSANHILLINSPFQYIFFANVVIFFTYTLIASHIIHLVFRESKTKFFVIGICTFLLTYAVWNAANLYGLYYVQHRTVCGTIAMQRAKALTAESMLKKYYRDEYDIDVSYLEVENVKVKGSHISRHFRIKDGVTQIGTIGKKLRAWRSTFQVSICEKEFYSAFRDLDVSVTEIYKFKGEEFYKFTVAAADCP